MALINYENEARRFTRLWFNDDDLQAGTRLWEVQQIRNRLAGDRDTQAKYICLMASQLIEILEQAS